MRRMGPKATAPDARLFLGRQDTIPTATDLGLLRRDKRKILPEKRVGGIHSSEISDNLFVYPQQETMHWSVSSRPAEFPAFFL